MPALPDPSRRRLLAQTAAVAAVAAPGCNVLASGTPDLTLANCTPDERVVQVVITGGGGGGRIYDHAHTVPGGSCGDGDADPLTFDDVFPGADTYTVSAEAGDRSTSDRVTFSADTVDSDDDAVSVRVDADGLEIRTP